MLGTPSFSTPLPSGLARPGDSYLKYNPRGEFSALKTKQKSRHHTTPLGTPKSGRTCTHKCPHVGEGAHHGGGRPRTLVPPLASCAALGKLLGLSLPQFLH